MQVRIHRPASALVKILFVSRTAGAVEDVRKTSKVLDWLCETASGIERLVSWKTHDMAARMRAAICCY